MSALRRDALALNANGPLSASDRVTSGGDRLGPPPPIDSRVEFGHRLGPLIGPHLSLSEHVDLRSDTLRSRGVDEAPDAGLERMRALWGCADDDAATHRLLASVACEALSDASRLRLMALSDTTAKLELVLEALAARKSKLSAEVALRRALDG